MEQICSILPTRESPGRYSFVTFEEYVEARWAMERQNAHRLIETAIVTEKMSQICDILPVRQSHVTQLLKLDSMRSALRRGKPQLIGMAL